MTSGCQFATKVIMTVTLTISLHTLSFFFSSRRRHTRLQGDWSSDVCSSDLLAQVGRTQLEFRLDLQHHAILIQLREHYGDLALAEGVIQRIVDHLWRDTEPRSRVAVDQQPRLQPRVLLIAGDIAQDLGRFEPVH